jgi:hypothetical protein
MVMVITKNGQYNKLRCPGMLATLLKKGGNPTGNPNRPVDNKYSDLDFEDLQYVITPLDPGSLLDPLISPQARTEIALR